MSDYDADATPDAVVIADDPTRSEYIATLDGRVVGVLTYERGDGRIIELQHTVVRPEARDRDIGTALLRDAFDQARLTGYRIIPTCSFIPSFLEDHPEYCDLIVEGNT